MFRILEESLDLQKRAMEQRAQASKVQSADLRQNAPMLVFLVAFLFGMFALLFVIGAAQASDTQTTGHLWWKQTVTSEVATSTRVGYGIVAVLFFLAAAAMVALGFRILRSRARLAKYPAIFAGVERISVQRLVEITGTTTAHVYRDLETLTSEDIFVDHAAGVVYNKAYIPKTSHKTVARCAACGAYNEIIVGVTKACEYCGEPLILPA